MLAIHPHPGPLPKGEGAETSLQTDYPLFEEVSKAQWKFPN
jgi:hypothetical protein